ncbi:MAG: amino acid permease [Micavibrio aeruginosavorus]|uniref:Amino acid permease n=1 Tax=Micavibrio aeruginosavorus TaxID=349221 RepID=A0A2W5FU32_9BACT|nr:MAG: amino acid permease [Micavibrio aeruginosavorus]
MSLVKSLFRRKAPDYVPQNGHELKPVLGAFDLILMGVGAIIGTGIFVLTGIAAATQAGPAVVVSFLISGMACAFAALSYAELSSSVKGCGSAYGYSYSAFGEIAAWVIGWILVLEYGVSVAAVANGWSGYFNSGLESIGFGLPEVLTKGPLAVDPVTKLPDGGIVNLPAACIILILMGMLIVGVKESARLNAAMVFVKILTIAVFIGVASFNVKPELWSPFMPFGWFEHVKDANGNDHTIGVLAAASLVFFAYVGFDAVSTAVEEAKDPQRNVPIGILGSLVFCTIIYIVVSGLLTGIVPYTELNVSSPVAHALHLLGINWASALVATGVIAGLTTVMLVLYYALTRIILAMSRDGLLPPFFSVLNAKTHMPVRTTVLCGLIMAAFAGFVPLARLAELVNIGTLSAFVIVCAGVMVMRARHPELPRPFKIPGGKIIPVLGVLSCGALILFLPAQTHLNFLLWLAVGILIYVFYSFRNSKLK